MNMTWNEFKKLVDDAIERRAELSGDIEIWYIDISFPNMSHERTTPVVGGSAAEGLTIEN